MNKSYLEINPSPCLEVVALPLGHRVLPRRDVIVVVFVVVDVGGGSGGGGDWLLNVPVTC